MSHRRKRLITAALLLGTFLASIEVTVVAAAMPSVVEQIGGLSLYPWVFSSYLIMQTVTIPIYGRLADLLGRRTVYVFGVIIFMVGSALCGLAPSMKFLVTARAVQGLGAGAVLPLTMTIFGDLFDVALRTKLQGLFSLVWGVSSVVGPLAGGLIVQHASWRWVFFLNIPFGLVSALAVGFLLRESSEIRSGKRSRPDLLGAALLAATTFALLIGLLPPDQRPLDFGRPLWLALSLLFGILLIGQEKRHPGPILPLDLFRDRVHIAANLTGVFLGVVLFSLVSFVPLYVQKVQGGTPLHAGAILVPLSLGWTTASVIAGRIVWQVGFRFLVRSGSLLISLGIFLGVVAIRNHLFVAGIMGEIIYGMGMGALISCFTVAVQEAVPPFRRGIATAMTQFSRSIGGAVGVAALGALLSAQLVERTGKALEEDVAPAVLESSLIPVFDTTLAVVIVAGLLGFFLFPKTQTQPRRSK